jgi:hypothetical protein
LLVLCVYAETIINFSGFVQSGVLATFDNDTGNGIQLYSAEYDVDGVGVAVTLAGSFETKNAGAEFEFAVENINPGINYCYGWLSFLDDVLKIKLGMIDDDTWTTHGDFELDYANVTGIQFIVQPIDGLKLGFASALDSAKESFTAWKDNLSV